MSRLPAAVATLLGLFAAARQVQAQEAAPVAQTTAVYGLGGLGTPLGYLGTEIVQRLGPNVELAAGIGSGLTATMAHNGSTLQWALMPRLRIGDAFSRNLTLGAGISGGNFGDVQLYCDDCTTFPVHYTIWANFEIGIERWWQCGFAIRAFLGYAHGWQTATVGGSADMPYIGSGMGFAF